MKNFGTINQWRVLNRRFILQLCIVVNLKDVNSELLKDIERENKDCRCRWFIYSPYSKFKTNIIKFYYRLRFMNFVPSHIYCSQNSNIKLSNEDVEYIKLRSFIEKIFSVYKNSDTSYSEILYCGNRWDGNMLCHEFNKLQYCEAEELMLVKFSKIYSMFD